MRIALTLAATTLLALPLAAQRNMDPDQAAGGTGKLPAGWSARLDKASASLADVNFRTMGSGVHATTGPAVVLWRGTDAVKGSFHVVGTFIQEKAPAHPEAYGLFIAGHDLQGDGQSYTYFLVRGNGQYLVKRRTGATTSNISDGWVANPAVVAQDADGKCTNKLEMAVGGGKVTFSVNGKEVYSMPAAAGSMDGIAGLRVNHNLDVHIDGFGVHQM